MAHGEGRGMNIPNTDDVRDAYIDTMGKCGFSESGAGAEFDLWLSEIKAEAWSEGHGTGLEEGTSRGLDIGLDPLGDHYFQTSPNPYRGR